MPYPFERVERTNGPLDAFKWIRTHGFPIFHVGWNAQRQQCTNSQSPIAVRPERRRAKAKSSSQPVATRAPDERKPCPTSPPNDPHTRLLKLLKNNQVGFEPMFRLLVAIFFKGAPLTSAATTPKCTRYVYLLWLVRPL